MKKTVITSAVLLAMGAGSVVPVVAQAGWSANVGMTTDYRFRGISQNDETFAIQGGFDYGFDNGVYVGLWASNVDFQVPGDETSSELDIYGGIAGEFSNGIGWDVGLLRYEYPNTASWTDYEFTEVYGSLSYKWFTASLARSGDYFAGSGDATYFNVAADFEFEDDWGVGASWGHQSVEENATWGTPDWDDWKAYVSKSYAGFDFELAYVDTDLSKSDCWGTDWCDSTLTFTVSKTFE